MPHRKQHDSRFKAQVAIEAIKNQQTIVQAACSLSSPCGFVLRRAPLATSTPRKTPKNTILHGIRF